MKSNNTEIEKEVENIKKEVEKLEKKILKERKEFGLKTNELQFLKEELPRSRQRSAILNDKNEEKTVKLAEEKIKELNSEISKLGKSISEAEIRLKQIPNILESKKREKSRLDFLDEKISFYSELRRLYYSNGEEGGEGLSKQLRELRRYKFAPEQFIRIISNRNEKYQNGK